MYLLYALLVTSFLVCICTSTKVAEPETRYDPVRLEEQLFKQPVKWLVRNVELFAPLGTFVAKVLFDIQVPQAKNNVSLIFFYCYLVCSTTFWHDRPYHIAFASAVTRVFACPRGHG